MYDLLQNVIRISPILVLLGIFVCLSRKKWYWRSFIIVIVGWIVFAVSTNVYWWYAFEFAPNEEVREHIALKDGAPRVFGTLFGWAFALIFLVVAELARSSVIIGFKLLKVSGKKFT